MISMQAPTTFSTARLVAHKFQSADLAILCDLHRDPQVMATLGGVRSNAQTATFLHEKMAHWKQYGFGYWIFRRQETGDFVGRGGIQHVEVGGKPEIEVGYTVAAACWRQGYATEMAEALVTMATETLDITNLVCFTLTTNQASRRVMEKVGFRFEREITHAGAPHVLYRLGH